MHCVFSSYQYSTGLFATLKNASKGSIQYSYWHNYFFRVLNTRCQSINGLLSSGSLPMIWQICHRSHAVQRLKNMGEYAMMVWGSA
jgi:hypothetical protein